jgi:hypothetical protein
MADAAALKRLAGMREADDVAQKLSRATEDMTIARADGTKQVIKAGELLPREQQLYIGRIFRQEVDLGGKQSNFFQDPELAKKIQKNIEVEVAFNPKTSALTKRLEEINRRLGNKQSSIEDKIGTQFRTPTGNVEEIVGAGKELTRSGKPKFSAITEPVIPTVRLQATPGLTPAIPKELGISGKVDEAVGSSYQDAGSILRGNAQVNSGAKVTKVMSAERKALLNERKSVSSQLAQETSNIETAIRSNYSIFDRKYTEQIRNHPKYQELSSIASEGRDVMDKWSKELVKSGIPSEQAKNIIDNNVGSYMARMYESKLAKTPENGVGFIDNIRLRLDGLKRRKDLSSTVLKQLGEIKEPAMPTAVRVGQISTSVANNNLFKQVASNPEWSSPTALGKMVQMPESKALGPLSGKFVVPEIAADINGIMEATKNSEKLFSKALSAWKYGKVVLNPATHARNLMTNTMLLDLSGTSHIDQARLFPKVMKDYLDKGELFQMATKHGAIGGEFVGGEVKRLKQIYTNSTDQGNLAKWMNVLKTPFAKAGEIYQAEEQLGKMVKFAHAIEQGATPEIAAKEAQKWLFDYNKVPEVISFLRNTGISPFITFTYKSVPRVAESIVNNPLRAYKYYALFNGWNEASRKQMGMSKDDYKAQVNALPSWTSKTTFGIPSNLMMPWKDKYGQTQFLNLEYLLPTGQLPEVTENGPLKGIATGPVINLFADLAKNTNFRGDPIVLPGSTKEEAAIEVAKHIYRTLAPTLAPGIGDIKGGYSFEKIMDSIAKRPDFMGRVKNLPITLLDTLAGLKITPVDTELSVGMNMKSLEKDLAVLNRANFKYMNPGVSEVEREKGLRSIEQKRNRLIKEATKESN